MNIRNYINILWRRKWVIAITVIAAVAVVTILTLKMTPIYSATTTMRIALSTTGTVSYQDYMYADRLMNTYVELATTAPVLDELKQRIGLTKLPSIDVKVVPTTELIRITINHSDPIMAADIANTLAEILISQSSQLYAGTDGSASEILGQQVSLLEQEVNQARTSYEATVTKNPSDTEAIQAAKDLLEVKQQLYTTLLEQYEQTRLKESLRANMISIVEPAITPEKPTKPNKILNLGLGFMVGIVGSIGLAFLFENVDTTLNTIEQIEAIAKVPIIGKVPKMQKQNTLEDIDSNFRIGESFRHLRTNFLSASSPIRILLVTSPEPKDGKSRISANIAYAMAQYGRKVVVVDGDLRAPVQQKLFSVDNTYGLSNLLIEKSNFARAIQHTKYPGIDILSSGPLPTNPSELLGSEHMKKVVQMLAQAYEFVILDSPAAIAVSDAIVLAPLADAITVVVQKEKTNSINLRTILYQINKANPALIGVIVNRAEANNQRYYYYQGKQASNDNFGKDKLLIRD